jgi:hypothetical protein
LTSVRLKTYVSWQSKVGGSSIASIAQATLVMKEAFVQLIEVLNGFSLRVITV